MNIIMPYYGQHNMTLDSKKAFGSCTISPYITGAYRTTTTSALQKVTDLQPSTYNQQEANLCPSFEQDLSSNLFSPETSLPNDYEIKSSGIHIQPCIIFFSTIKFPFAENHRDSGAKAIYTDGSKWTKALVCIRTFRKLWNNSLTWKGKLDHSSSLVFQAEILACN
ncbi:hypothetical protein AVEN_127647-1 [Araneus ventricosus]|uniref:RNase H type-1 domain-containing protein n=1 Tax=Araneus ventricosus TaxID=182803 RepID=A0A4Y2SJ37_ARAVE|nr:hypothetical protein AVEN_127647-1 [Araneus ventricosus]